MARRRSHNNVQDHLVKAASKSDDSLEARLVVRGFQQREYQENVYSPVGKMETLTILFSYCCVNNLFIEEMDVEKEK